MKPTVKEVVNRINKNGRVKLTFTNKFGGINNVYDILENLTKETIEKPRVTIFNIIIYKDRIKIWKNIYSMRNNILNNLAYLITKCMTIK